MKKQATCLFMILWVTILLVSCVKTGQTRFHKELSVAQVQSMPNLSIRKSGGWGIYGHSTIKHDYEVNTINGDKVVIDHTTGLMWRQSGSIESMKWSGAKQWVKDLNSRRYAGYYDWRLPTVEEAASLLESDKKNGDLYIDPFFDDVQEWIWTDNNYGSYAAWSVCFSSPYGAVGWYPVINSYYVRPVRSMK